MSKKLEVVSSEKWKKPCMITHSYYHEESSILVFSCKTEDKNTDKLDFKAGQYAYLSFPEKEGEETLKPMAFSIASPEFSTEIQFHVKVTDPNILKYLQEGEGLVIEAPFGKSTLRAEEKDKPLIVFAGGTGLAPMKSIIETALYQNPNRDIILYHGVKHEEELYFDGYFQDLQDDHDGFCYVSVLSETTPSEGSVHRFGYLGEALDFGSLKNIEIHIAGPKAMVDYLLPLLTKLYAETSRIHSDML